MKETIDRLEDKGCDSIKTLQINNEKIKRGK
jgi:hypothetical protein